MVIFATSQEWLTHSAMLLEARPTTTRVTTTYSIKPGTSAPTPKPTEPTKPASPAPPSKPPRGKLILKTYDPVSGACLKYRTTKAAEVSRLIQMLGVLGKRMSGVKGLVPAHEEDGKTSGGLGSVVGAVPGVQDVKEAVVAAAGSVAGTVAGAVGGTPATGGAGGGGGKGKKKKGKR